MRDLADQYLRERAAALGAAYDEARETRLALEQSVAGNLLLVDLLGRVALSLVHQEAPHGCLMPCELAHELVLAIREIDPSTGPLAGPAMGRA
jgi:hypothetical protein